MAGGCDLTLTPKRSRSRSCATRKCISPCPHNTMSWVRGLWIIVSEGSSSFSRNRAWPSLTLSLRSVAAIAIASTGAQTRCRLGPAGRFMAQRLHQAQHAVLARGRAKQHRADQPFAQFAGQIVEHRIPRRRYILEQLLHQRVVVVGELFQHREARFLLTVEIAAFEGYDFGSLVFAIDEGAFQRQIDEARDQPAVPDRNLPQPPRDPRRRLQCRERLADALAGLVDLVEEQEAGNAEIFELAQ